MKQEIAVTAEQSVESDSQAVPQRPPSLKPLGLPARITAALAYYLPDAKEGADKDTDPADAEKDMDRRLIDRSSSI